jgi:bifunctional enzyme CysN/CysC
VSETLDVVFAGHVDHGKSTLIARLLLDTGAFPDGRLLELETASRRRGTPVEISYLLDALQMERDQAVTIDASRIWMTTARRRYAIVDAPGHEQFVKNMISGGSDARLAVLLVDASEGIAEQTRRHMALLPLLGVRELILAVNKMDRVGFDRARFERLRDDVAAVCAARDLAYCGAIPTVARDGDNVAKPSLRMEWYDGASLVDMLDSYEPPAEAPLELRMPVQDVYRRDDRRVLVGTVQGTGIAVGADVAVLPSRYAAIVEEIVRFPADSRPVCDGEAVGIVLDRQLVVEPGDVISTPANAPSIATSLGATLFWFDARPLERNEHVSVRLGTRDVGAIISNVKSRLDLDTWEEAPAEAVQRNDIAQIDVTTAVPLAVDLTARSVLSRLAIYREGRICGGGVLTATDADRRFEPARSANVVPAAPQVSTDRRSARYGHTGGVVWLTGLPGAGKTTIAKALEESLFAVGWNACVLDGDAMRTGLNGDLGFSDRDRTENVRRVGEVAALFARNGFIAIVALVSPHAADRGVARKAGDGLAFHEIHVHAPIETCERRDPKGHYARARAGDMQGFTGVTAPYEAPTLPDLVLNTDRETVEESCKRLLELVTSAHAIGAMPPSGRAFPA